MNDLEDWTEEEWRKRIGDVVKERRLELGFATVREASRDADISETNWRAIESGRQSMGKGLEPKRPEPTPRTLIGVGRTLKWGADWLERLEGGLEPAEAGAGAVGPVGEAGIPPALLAKLAAANPSQLRAIEVILDDGRGYEDVLEEVARRVVGKLERRGDA